MVCTNLATSSTNDGKTIASGGTFEPSLEAGKSASPATAICCSRPESAGDHVHKEESCTQGDDCYLGELTAPDQLPSGATSATDDGKTITNEGTSERRFEADISFKCRLGLAKQLARLDLALLRF